MALSAGFIITTLKSPSLRRAFRRVFASFSDLLDGIRCHLGPIRHNGQYVHPAAVPAALAHAKGPLGRVLGAVRRVIVLVDHHLTAIFGCLPVEATGDYR
ncbi:hypothetical protein PG985_000423 [Apiospora marii]|uniref:Uncharacterized protein n=1 Tax=Apiospora marii TaxID=335849 RepID=A0ABR1R1Y7_9PEZI